MSGTDDLFPDATQHPGAAVPPPPPATPDLAVTAPGSAPAVAPRRRGLGAAAFVLGLLAVLGDVIGFVVALFTLLGAVTNLGETLNNVDNSLGAFLGVIILEFVVFFGGILFALLAVILGIVAAARNRGRVLGVFGVIFGLVVLAIHVGLAITVATSGNVPGVTS
ncbi:MAG: hypothetical protein ABIS08_11315 [Pseudolysinimonas sp.]